MFQSLVFVGDSVCYVSNDPSPQTSSFHVPFCLGVGATSSPARRGTSREKEVHLKLGCISTEVSPFEGT